MKRKGSNMTKILRSLILILGFGLIALLLLPILPLLLTSWGIYNLMDWLLSRMDKNKGVCRLPWSE